MSVTFHSLGCRMKPAAGRRCAINLGQHLSHVIEPHPGSVRLTKLRRSARPMTDHRLRYPPPPSLPLFAVSYIVCSYTASRFLDTYTYTIEPSALSYPPQLPFRGGVAQPACPAESEIASAKPACVPCCGGSSRPVAWPTT